MLRCFVLCFCFFFVSGVGNVLVASAEPLRIGFDEDYFPFSFKNPDGKYTGFDVDIAAALCTRLQRPCELIPMPFEDLFASVQQGKLDILVAGLAKNPEREKFLSFVIPYYRSRTALVGNVGENYAQVNAESLQGKRLAAQQGSVQHNFIVNQLSKSIYVPTATVDEALHAVRDGKADIALADSLVCMAVLLHEDMQHLDYVAEPLSIGHESAIAYIVTGLSQDALTEQVRDAFGQLRVSGEFNAINQKYFPFSIY